MSAPERTARPGDVQLQLFSEENGVIRRKPAYRHTGTPAPHESAPGEPRRRGVELITLAPEEEEAVRDLPVPLAFAYLLSRPFHAAAVERGEAEG